MRAAQRPQRKHQRHQQTIKRAERETAKVGLRIDGQFYRAAQRLAGDIGNRGAQQKAEKDRERRHQQHLRQRNGEDARGRRAERLQNRQGRALAVDQPLHRIGDAGAARDQRRQRD